MSFTINDPRYEVIRTHLGELRDAAGLSQMQLAQAVGTDQSNLSKVERGERYVDLLFYLEWGHACGSKGADAMKALERAIG